ncbi:unnamed protein product [Cylicocyclus nassatus]|uniref:Uncharacterized protein n=1 Tax=Cylicocyclus nassatus TaxID=53992 RepID=A0AA36H7Z8_CYLNA|nr:unnamed protein product [Cylicocyclus nassatus]
MRRSLRSLKKVLSVKDNTSTPPVFAVAGDNDPKNYACRALQKELNRKSTSLNVGNNVDNTSIISELSKPISMM